MEPISPELALVDPELAARARALLPEPAAPVVDVAPPPRAGRAPRFHRAFLRVAAWLVIPSLALNVALLRADAVAESVPAPTSSVSSVAPTTIAFPFPRLSHVPTHVPKPKRAGVKSARHVRTVRPRAEKRVLRWRAHAKSKAYDVVVWRRHRRIADVWTAKPRIAVASLACRGGRKGALAAGRYLWFVYPLVKSKPRRYGHLAKWGTFAVRARARCPRDARSSS